MRDDRSTWGMTQRDILRAHDLGDAMDSLFGVLRMGELIQQTKEHKGGGGQSNKRAPTHS